VWLCCCCFWKKYKQVRRAERRITKRASFTNLLQSDNITRLFIKNAIGPHLRLLLRFQKENEIGFSTDSADESPEKMKCLYRPESRGRIVSSLQTLKHRRLAPLERAIVSGVFMKPKDDRIIPQSQIRKGKVQDLCETQLVEHDFQIWPTKI
jgi:hypothetical protein